MRPTRLNLTNLRSFRSGSAHGNDPITTLLEESTEGPISRRRLIGIGGSVAMIAAPTLKALGASLASDLEIISEDRRVSFRLGGQERWAIDAAMFGGRPKLEVERSDRQIRIALSNATFPGTTLPADLVCELRPGLLGRKMKIEFLLGGFKGSVQLEKWLLGSEMLGSVVSLKNDICTLGSDALLRADGSAHAEFHPSWTFRFDGGKMVSLAADPTSPVAGRITGDNLLLSLVGSDTPGILGEKVARRSALSFERGANNWTLAPVSGANGSWRFASTGNAFDRIDIESGESRSGKIRQALVATSDSDHAALTVEPIRSLRGGDGAPCAIPLRRARYAVAFDGAGSQTAILARGAETPTWIFTDTVSYAIADDRAGKGFELVRRGEKLDHFEFAPAVVSTYMPMPDAVVSPGTPPDGTTLPFIASRRHGMTQKQIEESHLRFDPNHPDDPPISVQSTVVVSVLRPQDLLVFYFQFMGLSAQGSGKGLKLIRTGGSEAYLIAHMQPQNIAEEAFFELAPNVKASEAEKSKSKPDPDPDTAEGTPSTPKPYAPPVQAMFSGLSRLCFKVPSSHPGIQYTIEGLLTAMSELEMSVAPTALPPKTSNRAMRRIEVSSATTARLTGIAVDPSISVRGLTKKNGYMVSLEQSVARRSNKPSAAQVAILGSRARTYERRYAKEKYQLATSDIDYQKKAELEYNAGIQAIPRLANPRPYETAIESPYRLIVSPNKFGAWAHSPAAVTSGKSGRTELWHTRLAVRRDTNKDGKLDIDESYSDLRTIRAIWTRDGSFTPDSTTPPAHANVPFRMSLDAFDRHNIVHLSANFTLSRPSVGGKPRQRFEPLPIDVDRLMLTSQGAWMDVRGAWTPTPEGLSVEEWRHRGTMGRDNYVRVVYAGFLFPFGHRASLIKVTERKFHPTYPGNVAYLRQRMFIVVREPERDYRDTGIVTQDIKTGAAKIDIDNQMPFTRIRVTTMVTPNLDPPEGTESRVFGDSMQSAFWPRVLNKDFLFHMIAEDIEGETHEFATPVIFIGKEYTDKAYGDPRSSAAVAKEYELSKNKLRRQRPMNGQQITFAETTKPGDTSFETKSIVWGVQVPDNGPTVDKQTRFDDLPSDTPRFFPVVRGAEIVVPAIKQMTGNSQASFMQYANTYLVNNFADGAGQNKGQVFLEVGTDADFVSVPVQVDFNSKGDKAGGLVKPNMKVAGLSRLMGPISGTNAVANIGGDGMFKPEDFFGSFSGIKAKVFGVIDLWDLVAAVGVDQTDLIPKFVTEALNVVENFLMMMQSFLDNGKKYIEQAKLAGGSVLTLANTLESSAPKILDYAKDLPEKLTSLVNEINTVVNAFNAVPGVIQMPKAPNIEETARKEVEKRLNQIKELAASGEKFIQSVTDFANALEMAREMKVKFEWKPVLHNWGFDGIDSAKPLFLAKNIIKGDKPASFVISVEMRGKTDGSTAPSLDVICSLENFSLDLIAPASFIQLAFDKLQFFASVGKKADVNVEIAGIKFVGCLSFVEALRTLIPLDGFSDPPALDISAEGVKASFSISLPNIAFGLFSLQNLSLGAGFTIPFIGEPLSVYFNFCTRENPFLLTVSMFGGGGFFGITLDPSGVHLLEASFEFGASISIDLGVASGGVHVMAGIYFRMEMKDDPAPDEASLTGYLRLGGEVDVLGIISVSLELRMELTYEFASGKCIGRATLTIEIEVLFFSTSVEISCERKFAGSNGDPSFLQLMSPYQNEKGEEIDPWLEYCRAFA
jgi:hypothetical protein